MRAFVIFCDLVREESNGKRAFYGVFNEIMTVPSAPSTISQISVITVLDLVPEDRDTEFKIIIKYDNKEITGDVKLQMDKKAFGFSRAYLQAVISPFFVEHEQQLLEVYIKTANSKKLELIGQLLIQPLEFTGVKSKPKSSKKSPKKKKSNK
jgi:hypothetical protein